MQGMIKAVCISEEKGTEKHPVPSAHLTVQHGIDGDAHAGPWHRQVSLLSYEKVEEFNRRGGCVTDGAFGENLLVSGIDFRALPIGTVFETPHTKLRLTQIGKECHSHCAIYHRVGMCIMPHEGVFAEVLSGGDVAPGEVMTVTLPDEQKTTGRTGNDGMNVSVLKEIHTAAAAGRDTQLCFTVDGAEYVRRFSPAERLILLGCGHIGQALCRYAADLGFSVTAVDERPGFANHTQMPEAETILCDSFPNAIRRLNITERDYVCVITRGHRFDADCLREILPGSFPKYLGMIGSKRRVTLLLQQLENEGFSRRDLERIHAPIGIAINALTVKEIAISIVAELIQCRRADVDRRSKGTRLSAETVDRQLLEFLADDLTPKALLIVYETSGSTPVKSGAMMAVDRLNRTVGTIGGGCSENAVLNDARKLIGTGAQRSVVVDMSSDIAAEEGMVCGGRMKVLIADVSPE